MRPCGCEIEPVFLVKTVEDLQIAARLRRVYPGVELIKQRFGALQGVGMRDNLDPQRCRRGLDIAVIGARPIEHQADIGRPAPPCGLVAGRIPRRDQPAVAGPGDSRKVERVHIAQHRFLDCWNRHPLASPTRMC
jgi:hypothetical protein